MKDILCWREKVALIYTRLSRWIRLSLMKTRVSFDVMVKTRGSRWTVSDTGVVYNAGLPSATGQLNLSSRFAPRISTVEKAYKRPGVFSTFTHLTDSSSSKLTFEF